jgi:hypothetical protein
VFVYPPGTGSYRQEFDHVPLLIRADGYTEGVRIAEPVFGSGAASLGDKCRRRRLPFLPALARLGDPSKPKVSHRTRPARRIGQLPEGFRVRVRSALRFEVSALLPGCSQL